MDTPLTFRSYQEEAARTDRTPGSDLKAQMIPLLGLAGEAGSLLAEYKKRMREGDRYKLFSDQVSEELGDILWYLANIATKANLDLQEIAEENLAKVVDRFSTPALQIVHLFRREDDRYDLQFPENERLPSEVRVHFAEVMVDGTPKTELIFKGSRFGAQLTDNAHASDGYRFHDVFHWTIAVIFGWSPVVRSLLKAKRRSVHRFDEVEDGGLATVAEEAIPR
jgi:Predicted pyrophosphatase